jgi:hypothetical protein
MASELDIIPKMLGTSVLITKDLLEFDDPVHVMVILGTAIQTWCNEHNCDPQAFSLDLCNNICDIQDRIQGIRENNAKSEGEE